MGQDRRDSKKVALGLLLGVAGWLLPTASVQAQTVEMLKYGNMDQWIVRTVEESAIIGGQKKTLYHVAPNGTWDNRPYTPQGGSPWGCSNIMARVAGITKTNSSVMRDVHPGHGYCAKLYTKHEQVKVLGLVNIKVLAPGALFLGHLIEPITGTKDPMMKMNWGVPFTKRPKAICFDYKVQLSGQPNREKRTGFSSVKTVSGPDQCDFVLYLQKRWEDSNGNIYAKRVGTVLHRFGQNTKGWVENASFEIHYGDITKEPWYKDYMGLTRGELVRCAKNSKGKMTPVVETGWADANEVPTHLCLQFDSSHGEAYVGSPGNTLWVDNVRLTY